MGVVVLACPSMAASSKEIIGGMLDLESRLWKKGIRENFDDQRKKVLQFAQWWKPYDITKTKE